MSREEQLELMRSLTDRLQKTFKKNLERGIIPEEWGGHELRWLLRDMTQNLVMDEPEKSNRYKNYLNHVVVTHADE